MTNMKLLTNANAKGDIKDSDNPVAPPPFIMLYVKYKDNSVKFNTYLSFEDYPDFDATKDHKVYVDDNDKVLIKCTADLLDTSLKMSDIISAMPGFIPEYKYDEYI